MAAHQFRYAAYSRWHQLNDADGTISRACLKIGVIGNLKFSSSSRFTPFTHALFGIGHRNLKETLSDGTDDFTDGTTSFAMELGGGVDYKLNNRFALRLFQFDYNPILLRSRTINSIAFPNRTLNGVRISAGIVIK